MTTKQQSLTAYRLAAAPCLPAWIAAFSRSAVNLRFSLWISAAAYSAFCYSCNFLIFYASAQSSAYFSLIDAAWNSLTARRFSSFFMQLCWNISSLFFLSVSRSFSAFFYFFFF